MKKNTDSSDNNKVVHKFFSVRASAIDDNLKKINGTGHICLALKPSANSKTFRFAASFKSPADKLNRDLGMRIAEGRLISARPGRHFRVEAENLNEAFNKAIDSLFAKRRKVFRRGQAVSRPVVPNWLYDAVVEKERKILALK